MGKQTIKFEYDETEWLYAPEEEYADYDGCKRRLQMLFPYRREWKEDEKFPLVIFIPGAAWHRQEMYNSIPQYDHLAERGIFVAAMQHRESELAVFPAQIYDVHNAVCYLIRNAARWHIDTNRIFLAGNSSGAHIALMAAVTKANGLYLDQCETDYKISGVIAQSAPSDLMLCQAEVLPPWMKTRPTADLLGVSDVKKYPDLAYKASCEAYINSEAELPHILLIHGNQDSIVSVEHSRKLYGLLEKYHQPVTYYELDGIDHGGSAFWTDPVVDIMADFVKKA